MAWCLIKLRNNLTYTLKNVQTNENWRFCHTMSSHTLNQSISYSLYLFIYLFYLTTLSSAQTNVNDLENYGKNIKSPQSKYPIFEPSLQAETSEIRNRSDTYSSQKFGQQEK
jgi:hypothetical protein